MHWRLRKCDENFLIKQTKFGSKHTCVQIQNTINSKTQSAKSDLKHSQKKNTIESKFHQREHQMSRKLFILTQQVSTFLTGIFFILVRAKFLRSKRQTNDSDTKVAIWEEPILRTCQFEPSPLFTLTSPAFVSKYQLRKLGSLAK